MTVAKCLRCRCVLNSRNRDVVCRPCRVRLTVLFAELESPPSDVATYGSGSEPFWRHKEAVQAWMKRLGERSECQA